MRILKQPENPLLIEKLVCAILEGFENDYKSGALFIIFVSFTKKGFKDFTEDASQDIKCNLFTRIRGNLPFSYETLNDSICEWKKFQFTYNTLPEAYHFLLNMFKESFYNKNILNAERFLSDYKVYLLRGLVFLLL